jgi:hypothetical protein
MVKDGNKEGRRVEGGGRSKKQMKSSLLDKCGGRPRE